MNLVLKLFKKPFELANLDELYCFDFLFVYILFTFILNLFLCLYIVFFLKEKLDFFLMILFWYTILKNSKI
jgi:hypothetical protein